MLFRLIFLLMTCQVAVAVPEGKLPQVFENEVWAYYQSKAKSHWFTGADGKRIHFQSILHDSAEEETAAVVILPGRTESAFKYAEVVYDLRNYGLSFYILDHRGQGASDRVSDTVGASHVESFEHFKTDLTLLLTQNFQREHKRVFAIAHSMGANILSLFAIENPDFFEKIVLASPMLDIPTDPLPETVTYYLFQLIGLLGMGEKFVFGHGPYDPNESYRGTHSANRFAAVKTKRDEFKDQWIGGVTFSFVARCLEATWAMRNHSGKLTMPILMLHRE